MVFYSSLLHETPEFRSIDVDALLIVKYEVDLIYLCLLSLILEIVGNGPQDRLNGSLFRKSSSKSHSKVR